MIGHAVTAIARGIVIVAAATVTVVAAIATVIPAPDHAGNRGATRAGTSREPRTARQVVRAVAANGATATGNQSAATADNATANGNGANASNTGATAIGGQRALVDDEGNPILDEDGNPMYAATEASGVDATAVGVEVWGDAGVVRLRVHDDGEGARPSSAVGYGLLGMAERAKLLGGTCHAGPDPAGGWTVEATLPRDVPR